MRALPLLLSLVVCATAAAQTLNLGGVPTPPPAGAGTAALALADALEAEAIDLSASADTRPRARAALRTVAAAMIRAGEEAGPAGSVRILLGRTLAANLPAIDHFFEHSPDEPTLELLIHDAQRTFARLQAAEPECERALRELLAQSAEQTASPSGDFGWFGPPFETHPTIPGDLDRLLSDAQHWTAYAHSALYLRDLVAGAHADPAIDWIDPAARLAMDTELTQAMAALRSPETLDAAVARLRLLVRGHSLLRAVDALKPSGPEASRTLDRAKASLAQHLATPPTDVPADLRALGAFERVLSLITARAGLPSDTTLLRELRPAYRAIHEAARASETKLAEALPTVFAVPDAMTQPGLLSAVAAHHRAAEDLRLLVAASDALSRPTQANVEPQAAEGLDRVAARLLGLAQDVARKDRRDASLPRLRDLCARLVRSHRPPALEGLRNALPGSSLALLTGERQATLAGAFDDCRAAWLRAIADGDEAAAGREAEQLDTLLELLDVLADAARAHAAITPGEPAYRRLQTWPGWQLSPEALAALVDGVEVAFPEASALALSPSPWNAREAIGRARARFAPALLTGRLIAQAAGWRWTNRWVDAAVFEVCTGPPLEGWSTLAEHQGALADICRYAEELAAARALGDTARAQRLEEYLEYRATGVLAALD